ncbi:hypothetical protein P3W85_33400 [Cupriavidus basilensis]|uniref:DUF5666 domain-containing protein n=1 Tax=Cupriavidus basilensis TaxID=68895 RepID=A0ABT6AYU3_9BURK|nr:hypothetical protein [Cupriavidus basilensis]MDF3837795.1 hypothetical protein [Cupriavidus basilensis]
MPDRRPFSRALYALSLGAAVFFAPPSQAAPPVGVGMAEESVVSGRVIAIDPDSKAVLVEGPRGNVVELIGGAEARNFRRINKGDVVSLARRAVAVTTLEPLDSKDAPLMETVERTARAGEGAKPGFVREITTTVTAQITKVDARNRTVTFRTPRETLRTVNVRDPNINLDRIKTGRLARIVYREAVSVTVSVPASSS